MKRIIIVLILSAAATAVLFVGAGMAGGACHCMTPMYTLFPYGSFVMMHFSSDGLGLPLALLQFPAYVVVLSLVRGTRRKLGVLLLLIVPHVSFASFALRDYCQTRRTCFLRRYPATRRAGVEGARFSTGMVRRRFDESAPPRQL